MIRLSISGALVATLALSAGAALAGCADDATAPEASPSETSTSAPTSTSTPTTTTVSSTPTSEASAGGTESPADRDFSAVGPIVQAFVEEHDLRGAGLVVVQRDDGIVHEEYWGDFDADRISLLASATKMITAGVLLHLHDHGVLDIDAPVADVVEWGSANPDITPAQLVSNSSGLVGLVEASYPDYVCQFVAAGELQTCAERVFTTTQDDADVVPPDTEFRYGGAQWQVAGAVAEAASGSSWAQLVDEIYVEPCGLETLGYNNHFLQLGGGDVGGLTYPDGFDGDPSVLDPTTNPNMEGGAYAAPHDYAALLLMHLRDGMCGDTRVLSAESLDRAHDDRVAEAYGEIGEANPGYGMGWWIDRETGLLTDPGAYGAVPWLDLDDGFGAYLVIEETSLLGLELAESLYAPVEAAVLGRP